MTDHIHLLLKELCFTNSYFLTNDLKNLTLSAFFQKIAQIFFGTRQ